jgi:hypothetical protein
MTEIFVDFVCQFDARMCSVNRNVLLFLGMCPTRPSEYQNDFLPCKLHQHAAAP